MKPQQLAASLDALDALSGVESLCCFVTEDERPLSGAAGFLDWRLCGELSRVLRSGFFIGRPGERLLLPSSGRVPARRLFLVGLGPAAKVTPLGFEHALAAAATMLTGAQVASVGLAFPSLPPAVQQVRDELFDRAFGPKFAGAVTVFTG